MEVLFEALLQFFFELILEITAEIAEEIFGEGLSHIINFSTENNLPTLSSFSDEIIKLDIFK